MVSFSNTQSTTQHTESAESVYPLQNPHPMNDLFPIDHPKNVNTKVLTMGETKTLNQQIKKCLHTFQKDYERLNDTIFQVLVVITRAHGKEMLQQSLNIFKSLDADFFNLMTLQSKRKVLHERIVLKNETLEFLNNREKLFTSDFSKEQIKKAKEWLVDNQLRLSELESEIIKQKTIIKEKEEKHEEQ